LFSIGQDCAELGYHMAQAGVEAVEDLFWQVSE
jgi:hypothetical protein